MNCGYVPLVDSAPLIVAQELGFAADEGITLNLLKQPSWAALRDLLALGHLDLAHMLAPMPVAMTLGLSGPRCAIDAPLVLSANGTVIGAACEIAALMRRNGWRGGPGAAQQITPILFSGLGRPVRVGVPFPYSMHRLLFDYLAGGADARLGFEIITTPPALMADTVARGDLDLFCVGEPWGTVAVQSGGAELLLPGSAIWAHAPEKVLAMRRNWGAEHEEKRGRALRAVYRASHWLGQPKNRPLAINILAKTEHLGLPEQAIDPALLGMIVPQQGAAPWDVPNFLKFHSEATTFPWRSQGAWIGARVGALNGLDPAAAIAAGAGCFRPDLYRQHLAKSGADLPGASSKIEGALGHPTAVASTRGEMSLGPDAFFDGKTSDFDGV